MPPAKGVTIRIGDRTKKRQLRFDSRALERLQDETACKAWPDGMPLTVMAQQIDLFSIRVVHTALWVGLLHDEPDLERDEVVDMLDSRRLDEYTEALGKALEDALPEDPDEKKGKKGEGEQTDEEGKAE